MALPNTSGDRRSVVRHYLPVFGGLATSYERRTLMSPAGGDRGEQDIRAQAGPSRSRGNILRHRLATMATLSGFVAGSCLMALWGGTTAAASSTSVTTGSSAAAGSGKAPIVVGGDGDSLTPGIGAGFEAGIYRFNQAGGLDGRKIKFTGFLDDAFNGQTNLTNAQQLVENEHVMAVVPFVGAVANGATSSFLAGARVPFIGWATNSAYLTQPTWGFGINGSQGNPDVQGVGGGSFFTATNGATTAKKVKMALIAENVAPGVTALNGAVGAFKFAGADVVYHDAPIPVLGTTNYAPYAQAIIGSHPNLVFEVLDESDSVGLAAALKSAGYKGSIVNGVSYVPGQLASQPNEAAALNGVYVIDQFPADENNTPAVKQAKEDLISVGQPPYLTAGVSQGYWSAIVFEQMLKATLKAVGGNPNKVTGPALQKTVNGGFTYTDPISGGIGTEHFPAAESITTGCSTLVKVVGNGYKQISPFQCGGAVNIRTGKRMSQITGKPIP
jgi:ABC-type branched-subunit amino acid transport system substrate-binding protein